MKTEILTVKMSRTEKVRRVNPYAAIASDPKFKPRVIQSKTKYNKKKSRQEARKHLTLYA